MDMASKLDIMAFEGEHIRKAGLWVFIMSRVWFRFILFLVFENANRMVYDWAIRDGVEA